MIDQGLISVLRAGQRLFSGFNLSLALLPVRGVIFNFLFPGDNGKVICPEVDPPFLHFVRLLSHAVA